MNNAELVDEAKAAFRSQCEKNGIPYTPAAIAAFNNAIVGLCLALDENENERTRGRRCPPRAE